MNPSQINATLDDTEIISQVVSGDTERYQEIVRRYNGYLYKVGKSYGYRHAEIEDLMQETYINAFMNLKKFENRSSFKTWIVRIMLNACYHKKQKAGYKNEQFADYEQTEDMKAIFENRNTETREMVQNNELKRVLENAIHQIPENYRMVFTLRELNGMSVRETAEALKISEGNVKVRFNRSKAMLQNEIKKSYAPEEIFEFNLIYCDAMVDRVMDAVRGLEISK